MSLRPALLLLAVGAAGAFDLQTVLPAGLANFSMEDLHQAMESVTQCAALPGDFKAIYGMSQCTKSGVQTLEDDVVQGLLVGRQFVNISDTFAPFVQALAEVGAKFILKEIHDFSKMYCSHPECATKQDELMAHMGSCEAGYICGIFAAEDMPGMDMSFSKCKVTFQNMMTSIFGAVNGLTCQVEASSSAYCPEAIEDFLLEDFDCYMEFAARQSCSKKCAVTWNAMKTKYPTCSAAYDQGFAKVMDVAQGIAQELVPGAPTPPPTKSFDEVCGQPRSVVV